MDVTLTAPVAGPDDGPTTWRRTVRAEIGDEAVGQASITANPQHRDSYVLEVEVEPTYRRRGVGTALAEAVLALPPRPYRAMGRAMASRPDSLSFALALGFAVGQTGPAPQLDPTGDSCRAWASAVLTVPVDAEVIMVDDVSPETLTKAWVRLYEWVHADWSPMGDPTVVAAVFSSRLLPAVRRDVSVVLRRDGTVVAFALVVPGWQDRVFVLTETVEPDEPDGLALVRRAVAEVLHRTLAVGVGRVEFEGHLTDPHLGPVLTELPAVGHDELRLLFRSIP